MGKLPDSRPARIDGSHKSAKCADEPLQCLPLRLRDQRVAGEVAQVGVWQEGRFLLFCETMEVRCAGNRRLEGDKSWYAQSAFVEPLRNREHVLAIVHER